MPLLLLEMYIEFERPPESLVILTVTFILSVRYSPC